MAVKFLKFLCKVINCCLTYFRLILYLSIITTSKGDAPELKELLLLQFSNGKELRIRDRISHIWKNLAITLGFNQAKIKGIEISCHYQPEDATYEMFRQWLKGAHGDLKPATWSTLIQSLRDVKLTGIADMLSNLVCLH